MILSAGPLKETGGNETTFVTVVLLVVIERTGDIVNGGSVVAREAVIVGELQGCSGVMKVGTPFWVGGREVEFPKTVKN